MTDETKYYHDHYQRNWVNRFYNWMFPDFMARHKADVDGTKVRACMSCGDDTRSLVSVYCNAECSDKGAGK